MKAALRYYHVRMQLVLDHIDRHPDDNLDLDVLSGIAAFSKYHFHRLFTATFGLPVHRYVQLVQMKRASYRLAYRDAASVTDIAMDAGYEAPDGLNQLYRERNGTSPNDRILSAYQKQQKSIEASAAYEGFKTAFAEHAAELKLSSRHESLRTQERRLLNLFGGQIINKAAEDRLYIRDVFERTLPCCGGIHSGASHCRGRYLLKSPLPVMILKFSALIEWARLEGFQ